ncbi:MAG: hypothetical protein CMQ13_04740 [Gammaproteobacteria bacterium]|nr:hypothetical protein [Gammaproteobacteria bacterium]
MFQAPSHNMTHVFATLQLRKIARRNPGFLGGIYQRHIIGENALDVCVSIVKGADHFFTLSKEHVKNACQIDTGGQYHKNSV